MALPRGFHRPLRVLRTPKTSRCKRKAKMKGISDVLSTELSLRLHLDNQNSKVLTCLVFRSDCGNESAFHSVPGEGNFYGLQV